MNSNFRVQPSLKKESPNQTGFDESDFFLFVALLANV